ncbi:hypothetical protein [Endozoicomonas sp. OPT23]|nr:hypothetical protein [Endozoicomonas sp. OPT23]
MKRKQRGFLFGLAGSYWILSDQPQLFTVAVRLSCPAQLIL